MGIPIVGRGVVDPQCSTNAFAVNLVDVEVDPETGKVTILRFTVCQDAGQAIHPSYVEGQMQGGSAQGIGWALKRRIFLRRRRPHAQRQLPGLSHTDVLRPAHD